MRDVRDRDALRQDERLRLLERELLREGRTLHEWAAAILDVPPTLSLTIRPHAVPPAGTTQGGMTTLGGTMTVSHEVDGVRMIFSTEVPRVVEISVSRRVPPYGVTGSILWRHPETDLPFNPPPVQTPLLVDGMWRATCGLCGRSIALRVADGRRIGILYRHRQRIMGRVRGICRGSGERVQLP